MHQGETHTFSRSIRFISVIRVINPNSPSVLSIRVINTHVLCQAKRRVAPAPPADEPNTKFNCRLIITLICLYVSRLRGPTSFP